MAFFNKVKNMKMEYQHISGEERKAIELFVQAENSNKCKFTIETKINFNPFSLKRVSCSGLTYAKSSGYRRGVTWGYLVPFS